MTIQKYSKGSEWRKWDLHIHTPASYHWNDGKKFSAMTSQEASDACRKIIEKLNQIEPVAFSVMDYFTFDGVLKIREYIKKNPTTSLKKTLFPGMELRIEAPTDFRLNIHVIFDDAVTDQELKDFKGKLQILGNTRPLSRESIIQCARTLTEDKAKEYIGNGDYKNDEDVAYELGCKTIRITRSSFDEAVTALGNEKCLVILPYETSNGIEKLDWKSNPHEDRYFLGKADFFESRNQDNIDLFLNRETDVNRRFIKDFINTIGGRPKPVVSGSDAHKVNDYGVYPSNRITWLKAEATFKGLKQVKVEPISRCYIGEKPEKLKIISTKATKFISKIEVKKTANSKLTEAWFDNSIQFNPELVAIIGNKGSGKSALADILGLLGNSTLHENFSFLNSEKFKEKQGIKAANYQATLTWENGDTSQKTLIDVPEKSAYEKIRYIPQSYLEKLCNEIKSKDSLFDKELKAVIFSHIKQEDRLGYENLHDLLKFKTEETTKEIEKYRQELREVANQIIECRDKLTEDYKKSITNKLSAKQADLKAVKDAKPKDVQKPVTGSDPEIGKSVKKIEVLQKEELEVSGKITATEKEIQELTKKKASLEKAEIQIKNLEQETADKVSGYFVPTVIGIAMTSFAIWAWVGPEPRMAYAIINAVAVLIIACPCALGLATPLSIMVATGKGASMGILFKNAESIETLRSIDTLVVDKTGTLTMGKPKLVTIEPIGVSADDLLTYAASLEMGSEHPLAKAITDGAKEKNLTLEKIENFQSVTGQGVQGNVGAIGIAFGNQKLMESLGISVADHEAKTNVLRSQGQTIMFVSLNQKLAGFIGVADPIKETTPEAIEALHKDGIRIIMMTGDNETTAKSVAKKLGIDDVIAGVLPEQKAQKIKELQAKGFKVAMAGDGINDAPALAQAQVGIAMGTGTDVAMESASVTLVKGDLRGIVRARQLSRATMRNIKQNLFFAFGYNVLGVPIAAGILYPSFGILLSPMIAALAMSLSSVSVITNALRLRKEKI